MKEIRVGREGGVVTVTLDRPERKNAISVPMWHELVRIFEEVAGRADDRVLVLTGSGGVFCAGGDLGGSASPAPADPRADADPTEQAVAAMRETVNAACLALHRLPLPTLAAVDGVAAGAGANLAFGCDLVFASASARFAELFVRRALPLDSGGSWLLPRLVGLQKAKELAFFGEFVDAEQAQRLGLVNRVVAAGELAGWVAERAAELATRSPAALAEMKRGLNAAFERTLEEALEAEARGLADCVRTPEFAEALRAFLGRRERTFAR